jgi:2-hydroxychromene-2-carboxylate isomerase
MTAAIDFYFDFSSPYGYLAAQAIDDVGARHGIDVAWRPFLLGAVFKITGARPLPQTPLKDRYAAIDMPRSARLLGVPFVMPEAFPFLSVAACRAYYWLAQDNPARSRDFARAVFHGAFGEGRDMSSAEAVIEEAAKLGIDRDALGAALGDPAVKDRLRREVDAAIDRGVYGSPFFFLGDEPFWGHDRLDQVDRWLETGGW